MEIIMLTTQSYQGDDEPAEQWQVNLEDENSETVKNMSPFKVIVLEVCGA